MFEIATQATSDRNEEVGSHIVKPRFIKPHVELPTKSLPFKDSALYGRYRLRTRNLRNFHIYLSEITPRSAIRLRGAS